MTLFRLMLSCLPLHRNLKNPLFSSDINMFLGLGSGVKRRVNLDTSSDFTYMILPYKETFVWCFHLLTKPSASTNFPLKLYSHILPSSFWKITPGSFILLTNRISHSRQTGRCDAPCPTQITLVFSNIEIKPREHGKDAKFEKQWPTPKGWC